MDVRLNDIIIVRKSHPCGGNSFTVLRIGADFRIKCNTCGREVMLARSKIEKNIKKIERNDISE